MKRLLSSWTLLCVLFQLWAQIPAGYYEFATGTHGSGLKTALFSIITEHTERSYKRALDGHAKKQTYVKTERYGICIPLLPTSHSSTTSAGITAEKATATTGNTLSPKVGSTMPNRCTPTYSISIPQTEK